MTTKYYLWDIFLPNPNLSSIGEGMYERKLTVREGMRTERSTCRHMIQWNGTDKKCMGEGETETDRNVERQIQKWEFVDY